MQHEGPFVMATGPRDAGLPQGIWLRTRAGFPRLAGTITIQLELPGLPEYIALSVGIRLGRACGHP